MSCKKMEKKKTLCKAHYALIVDFAKHLCFVDEYYIIMQNYAIV
jgi:hypothetical protein